jgi:hypothetical protein
LPTKGSFKIKNPKFPLHFTMSKEYAIEQKEERQSLAEHNGTPTSFQNSTPKPP